VDELRAATVPEAALCVTFVAAPRHDERVARTLDAGNPIPLGVTVKIEAWLV
jgi:hypothetical protein